MTFFFPLLIFGRKKEQQKPCSLQLQLYGMSTNGMAEQYVCCDPDHYPALILYLIFQKSIIKGVVVDRKRRPIFKEEWKMRVYQ